jgi:serine protease Do
MLQAFKEAVDDCWQCTVQVYCDGDQCAYGTIVDQDGWIITKASELDGDRKINCVLSDQREFKAELVSTLADLDLALLRIPINGLSTIQWEYSVPEQGKWLATTDSSSELPAAIGVVSAGPSRIPNQRAVLGVELAPDETREKAGAKIKHVLVGSGAYLAGLRQDDLISSVNGAAVQTRDELLGLLRSGKGGQFLKLLVQRGEQQLDLRVRLMDLSYELLDETELEVNGPISARATGFQRVFMHDTVIQPNQCGGPVVNLDGKAVGINIARAGRVSTYALPADTVRPAVQGLLEHAKLVSHATRTAPAEAGSSPDALDIPYATAP